MGFEPNGAGQRNGRDNVARLSRLARERADAQARHILWPRLLDTRNQYLDWQEFHLWARSIIEVEKSIPDWLAELLRQRCPGFVEDLARPGSKAPEARPDYLRLEDWIDENIFGFTKREGWFNAISFYALRELRYQRAQAYWSECVERWKKAKPVQYPSFEEWKLTARRCDDGLFLTPTAHQESSSIKLIAPEWLAESVGRYIDWEALAYWVRSALESFERLPAEVAARLQRECPGFLDAYVQARDAGIGVMHPWAELMRWISDHFFQEARSGGWFDAIIGAAQIHPRAIRTLEYADDCDEQWSAGLPVAYPKFEEWRRQADAYVELDKENV
jgi:hypothetical protein